MGTPFQEDKLTARRAVHEVHGIPSNYYVPSATPTAQPVTVRLHKNLEQTGDVKGTNFIYAERPENETYLVFLREQVASPVRNSVVVLNTGEVFFVDTLDPPDGITIRAKVVQARAEQIESWMVGP